MALSLLPLLFFMNFLSKVNYINKGLSSESYTLQKEKKMLILIFFSLFVQGISFHSAEGHSLLKRILLIPSYFPHLRYCLQLDDYNTLLESSRCGFKSRQTKVRIKSSLAPPGKVQYPLCYYENKLVVGVTYGKKAADTTVLCEVPDLVTLC